MPLAHQRIAFVALGLLAAGCYASHSRVGPELDGGVGEEPILDSGLRDGGAVTRDAGHDAGTSRCRGLDLETCCMSRCWWPASHEGCFGTGDQCVTDDDCPPADICRIVRVIETVNRCTSSGSPGGSERRFCDTP